MKIEIQDHEVDLLEYFETIKSEVAVESAKNMGCIVVFPQSNELQIDLDGPVQIQHFDSMLPRVQQWFEAVVVKDLPSKSGLKFRKHVTIRLKIDVDDVTRIALQAILGSDPVREFLSLVRISQSDPHPTLFIEKKV